MVTLQEIQRREEELSSIEAQARSVSREKIPQRRFGAGVTPEQQQEVIQRRQKAQEAIEKVKEERKLLKGAKSDLQSRNAQVADIEKRQEDYNIAYSFVLRRKSAIALTPRQRRYYNEIQAGNDRRRELEEQRQKLIDAGLDPVFDEGGTLVGFRDAERGQTVPVENLGDLDVGDLERYREAGAVEFTTRVQPTQREEALGMSLTEEERNLNPQSLLVDDGRSGISNRVSSRDPSYPGGVSPFTQRPVGTVSEVEEPTNLLEKAQREVSKARRQGGVSAFIAGGAQSFVSTARAIETIATQPLGMTLKGVVGSIKDVTTRIVTGKGFPEVGKILREETSFAVGNIAGELALLKGSGKAFEVTTSQISKVTTILDPKFVKVTEKGIKVPIKGEKITIRIEKTLPRLSLREQVALAGKEVRPISAARDLFSVTKKEIDIAKPIPGQEKLSRASLEKISKVKTLPPKEIAKLNKEIVKETGSKGLLERAFFVDPFTRLRPKRLGIQKQERASLADILGGEEITFREPSRQAIIFEKQKVAKFPKELSDVKSAISKGKPLTGEQTGRLLKFQFATEGQFSPVGFVSREAELVAFGKIIEPKKVGVTLIEGKKVKIIEAKLEKASLPDSKSLKKALEISDVKEISKLTGLPKSQVSYSLRAPKYVSPSRALSLTSLSRKAFSGRTSYGKLSRKTYSPFSAPKFSYSSTVRSRIPSSPRPGRSKGTYPRSPTPYVGIPRYAPPVYVKTPGKGGTKKVPRFRIRTKDESNKILQTGYRPFVIKGGQKVFLGGALPKAEALFKAETRAKLSLRATFGVEKTNKKVLGASSITYTPSKELFRGYRIREGKKVKLQDTFIQRKGKRLAFGGEVREIQRARKRK